MHNRTIHPKVKEIAKYLGVELVDRNASESWVYDGQTLALWYQHPKDDYEPGYVPPIHWFTDHDLLHELGHVAGCWPEQKDLPECGLAWGIVVGSAFGPYGLYRPINHHDGHSDPVSYAFTESMALHGLLNDDVESDIQEYFAQEFSIYFGELFGISPLIAHWKQCTSWEFYKKYKWNESDTVGKSHRPIACNRLAEWLKANETVLLGR